MIYTSIDRPHKDLETLSNDEETSGNGCRHLLKKLKVGQTLLHFFESLYYLL